MLPEKSYMYYTCSWGTESITSSRFSERAVTLAVLEFTVLLGLCIGPWFHLYDKIKAQALPFCKCQDSDLKTGDRSCSKWGLPFP